ncbi:RDD family protein [Kitasatospora sp. NPDC059571]|uniref:RDD family protein n=1 Tax=Kitasatospora sp. NPDC059571 TaxID=3346871 RepID=UPI0036C70B24
MSDLVTGEAVVLGLRTAKVPSRALAIALDLSVEFIGLAVTMTVVLTSLPGLDEAAAAAVVLGLSVFFLLGVPVMVETLSRGRSLGKLALGLRVVRSDGGPVRFRHALVRGLVGVLEIQMLVGAGAVISSLLSPQGRRLGDLFAGTLVVRERIPQAARAYAELPPVPPALLHAIGGELVALDLSAVPDGLWLAIRQFLGRQAQLDPAVAQTMAGSLAAELAGRTGRPAPYGLHPAAYLAAVLTERQRREWERAAGAARPQPYAGTGAPAVPAPGLPAFPAGPAAPAAAVPPVVAPAVPQPEQPSAPPAGGAPPPRARAVAAEAGGEEARELAERLTSPLESATRLTMLNVLSAAMDEITRELAPGSVDVRLRGLDPDFVVTLPPTDHGTVEAVAAPVEVLKAPAPADEDEGGTARVNLRLPAHLKARAEEAASREGLSVNAWLVRAVSAAVDGGARPRSAERARAVGQSFTGWVR